MKKSIVSIIVILLTFTLYSISFSDVLKNVVVTSDEKYAIVSGNENYAIVYQLDNYKVIKYLNTHKKPISNIILDEKRGVIALGSYDGTVTMWDAKTFELKRKFEGHNSFIVGVKFAEKDKQVITYGDDGVFRVYRKETVTKTVEGEEVDKEPWIFKFKIEGYIYSIGDCLLWYDRDNFEYLIVYSNWEKIIRMYHIYVPEYDERDYKYRIASSFSSGKQNISGVIISPVKNYIVCYDSSGKISVRYQPEASIGLQLEYKTPILTHDATVNGILFYNDDNEMVSWASDGKIKHWNLEDGSLINELKVKRNSVKGCIIVKDKLAAFGTDKKIKLYDIKDMELVQKSLVCNYPIKGIKTDKEQKYIFTYECDTFHGYVRVWDANTLKFISQSPNLRTSIKDIVIVKNGTEVIITTDDNKNYVWCIDSNRTKNEL